MDKKGIQKYNIDDLTYNMKKYKGIEWLPSMKKYKDIQVQKLILSDDGKIIVFTNNSCYNIYLVIE